ncbi:MAG: cysteine desulfurase-like protein [Actinobacteria bacterium]|nr:cysteine desulfurase-like protein [Actinomycetota bacterium]
MLDVEAVRARFPALMATDGDGRRVVHADAPGGTQVPEAVITAMADYLRTSNANQHGPFERSRRTDALCDRVREQAASFLGADADGVVFGPNMTSLTFHFSRAATVRVGEGDELVCTRLDHDANVSPWLALAGRTGAVVRWVPLAPDGTLVTAALDEVVTPRTRLVAFPRASNAFGTLVDPAPFVAAARAVGALTFMDAVHAAPHVALEQARDGVDVLVCSPYKFFGPHAGVLSADPALLASLRPDKARAAPDAGPERWQTGTASFEAIAGVGAACGYLAEVGMAAVREHEISLSRRFLDGVERLPHVRLHGPGDPHRRTPTFAVTLDSRDPAAAAGQLAARGVQVWSGHYYAVEPMRALGLLQGGGAVRIGFAHYHGPADVDRVLEALGELRPAGRGV